MTTTTFHIVGDAFVDLLCFLDGSNSLPEAGGDSRLDQPVKAYAGGSGLNTATHLKALSNNNNHGGGGGDDGGGGDTATLRHERERRREIFLHTCLNPSDQYGQLLEKHAQEHGFPLINCHTSSRHHDHPKSCSSSSSSSHSTTNGGDTTNSNSNSITNGKSSDALSTGHCIIIVAGGERSFMTHVGCLEHFKASDLDLNRILGGETANHHDHHDHHHDHHHQSDANADDDDSKGGGGGDSAIHIHIAGYFNLSGFHHGNLATLLDSIREARRQQQQQQQQQQHPTVLSLVAQYDATQQWDGGLEKVVPLLDFLILNEVEASHIVTCGLVRRRLRQRQETQQQQQQQQAAAAPVSRNWNCGGDTTTADATTATTSTTSAVAAASMLPLDPQEWISYFGSADAFGSSDCIVVVTRGARGAMAFDQNHRGIIATVEPAVPVPVLVDPTGAGDAFAAGFLHGIWEHYWRNENEKQNDQRHDACRMNAARVAWSADAIRHGLMWGCAAGTATVTIRGASIPPRHEDIQRIFEQQYKQQQQQENKAS
jgi:sugar/nucleoside kinase (ribokinase family)